MLHQFVSNTPTALGARRSAQGRRHGRGEEGARAGERRRSRACASSIWARASRRRSAPGCSASRAPRSSRSNSRAAATSCARSARSSTPRRGYSLFWAVEGRGRKSVTLDLRTPDGQDVFRRLAATADVVVENFRPGTLEQWNIGPSSLPDRLVTVRISMFGQDGPYSPRPGLDRVGIGYGGLLNLTGYPDRPPVRVGVTISDYLTGVFAAQAAVARAVRARRARRLGRGDRRRAVRRGAAHPRVDARRRTTGSASSATARATGSPTRRRSTTTRPRDGKYVCIVAGSDANFARLCKAMDRLDLLDDPRFARLADRAEHGDTINGIVAEWTATLDAREIEARCVAHDVPVATAYTAADIFADPHFAAPSRPRHRRRSRDRAGAPAGAVPPRSSARRRSRPRARPRSARTPTRCSPSLGLSAAEIGDARATRASCEPRDRRRACSSCATTARSR